MSHKQGSRVPPNVRTWALGNFSKSQGKERSLAANEKYVTKVGIVSWTHHEHNTQWFVQNIVEITKNRNLMLNTTIN